jgi:hypothetical protein
MESPERPMTPRKRYRCRYCGQELPAWLPAFREPDGALLLNHLAQQHPDQVGAYLRRMTSDDLHDQVIVEAYELVEGGRGVTAGGGPRTWGLTGKGGRSHVCERSGRCHIG